LFTTREQSAASKRGGQNGKTLCANMGPPMNQHYANRRKIDPTKGAVLGDGSPNDNDRVEIGPTQLAFAEWAAAGLVLPDLDAMREYRWRRLTQALVDGHMVMWEYKNAPFLVSFNPRVAELRSGAAFFYNTNGDNTEKDARSFAAQVTDVMRAHAGSNTRIAVDKIMVHGLRALERAGFEVLEGEVVTERARAVKGPDEVLAMRCAHHACEAAIAEMEVAARAGIPGGNMSEDDVWAHLHAGNIRRGGEWIETRLLASGPRTNPWFKECGPRIIQNNEIVAFDTDLIGAYGFCIDISRTWWIGDQTPRADMVAAMRHARTHIATNIALLKPGVTIRELVHGGHVLDAQYDRQKYSCRMHGVGLCDEWPYVPYPDAWAEGAFEAALEPGMVLCVEALVSPEGGDFSIKLEEQVLITETGHENLTRYPFDAALSA
jgi:Xaa-Pro dipeptidase